MCGCWPEVTPSKPDRNFRIRDDGNSITLCNICWLEEVLSDQGDLKARLKIRGEQDLVVAPDHFHANTDKFCPACNRRLALLKVMASRLSEAELEKWRQRTMREASREVLSKLTRSCMIRLWETPFPQRTTSMTSLDISHLTFVRHLAFVIRHSKHP
jgi:hypothetical protein